MNSPTALGAGVGVSLPGLIFTWVTPSEKRVEKDRSKALDSYGMMDLLWGVEESDIRAVGVPTELQPKAKEILRATAHLARKGRLTVLKALVRSYCALTHDSGSRGERAEEFLSRIVSVARTLGESEVDDETIVAALLCQAPITLDQIEADFGAGVRAILEGHKRLLEVEQEMEIRTLLSDYVNLLCGEQGDNLRNLLQSIANDWRAVTLRVAWKHAELDGPFATKREQTNACWAAMNIYSVLAERAGMSLIKNSMEDRAFRHLMPDEYERITAEIDARQMQDEGTLRQARSELLQMLREDPIFQNNVAKYEVKGRVKSPYSIWRKCRAQNCTIDELHDLVALRVVCSPIVEKSDTPDTVAKRGEDLCHYVLSVVHKLRPHYRNRVKDYIRQPKANGYKSLHTTLQMRLRGRCTPFEVQIRTHEMHQVAEYGMASHFSYKGDKSLTRHQQETPTFESRGDFLSWVSQTLASSSVFVWGPDGRLLHLNPGTTLLDVIKSYYGSYAVHKKVSKRVLRQFKLNGQRALICRELRSGDVISM